MTATKEEWLDKFILGARLYAKRVMAEEELVFSIDGKQSDAGDSLSDGGDKTFADKEQEETTLDEAEVNTFSAKQFKTPKTNNKQKQIWFGLEQGTNVQHIDFLPSLPDNEDSAVLMLQSNSELHQHITVKLGKELHKLGSQVRKVGTMSLQVDSDFQESTEKILIRFKETDLASDHNAPTIWGLLSASSSVIQSVEEVSDDWKKDGSVQREEINTILKAQNDSQANLRSFKEGVKSQLEKI
ncbi:hypothetical protein ACA910_009963 [Epithemia clementina (nom. ined.)]